MLTMNKSESPHPPFDLQLILAGPRLGWSWCTSSSVIGSDPSCEINCLDPEASSESSDYEAYIEELQNVERRLDFYRGYHQPPNEEEYRPL